MPKRQHSLTFAGTNGLVHSRFDNKQRQQLWKEFGFSWDNEDYRQSTVNPDIQNAIPKEEDFLAYQFRHLSATTVGGGGWKATEFPEKVLKSAAGKLSFKPVYVNHNLEISNIVGVVGKAKFTPGFTAADGTKVPGGVDGPIFVDAKLHADICRKLSAMPVPHIQSVSVTVVFEWEPSHTFEDRNGDEDLWLFENRIGQMVDGDMVRRVATKIIDFYETSFVWLGADPFAKIMDSDGNLLNIEKSAIVGMEKFNEDPLNDLYKKSGRYFVEGSCISNEKKIDLVKEIFKNTENLGKIKTNFNKVIPKEMDEKLVKYLAERLGKQPEEITEDFLKGFSFVPSQEHTSLTALREKVTSIEDYDKVVGERDQFKIDLEAEKAALAANKPLVDFANSKLEGGKENALKFYRLSLNGKDEDEKVIQLIERAVTENDFDTLETLTKQYGGSAIDALEPSCTDCGSKNVDFRTTVETDGGDSGETDFESPALAERFRQ